MLYWRRWGLEGSVLVCAIARSRETWSLPPSDLYPPQTMTPARCTLHGKCIRAWQCPRRVRRWKESEGRGKIVCCGNRRLWAQRAGLHNDAGEERDADGSDAAEARSGRLKPQLPVKAPDLAVWASCSAGSQRKFHPVVTQASSLFRGGLCHYALPSYTHNFIATSAAERTTPMRCSSTSYTFSSCLVLPSSASDAAAPLSLE